jgi:hypothetical protein
MIGEPETRWVRRTRRPSGSISCAPVSFARAAICCDTVDVVRWCASATARIEPSRDNDNNCRVSNFVANADAPTRRDVIVSLTWRIVLSHFHGEFRCGLGDR